MYFTSEFDVRRTVDILHTTKDEIIFPEDVYTDIIGFPTVFTDTNFVRSRIIIIGPPQGAATTTDVLISISLHQYILEYISSFLYTMKKKLNNLQ